MDKQQRLEEIEKYIEKYYIPGDDDIEADDFDVEDLKVKGFFDHITGFLVGRKASKAEDAEISAAPKEEDAEISAAPMAETAEISSAPKTEAAENSVAPKPPYFHSAPSAPPDLAPSPVKRREFSRPMSNMTVSNRKLDELMSRMDETFSQRLLRMIRERHMSDAEVYKKAYVDRRHFAKIRKDENYTPSKKTVLAFAIALELNLDETKDLLRSAGYALSRSSKFDIIVVYFLENRIYDMFDINEVLFEYGQPVFE